MIIQRTRQIRTLKRKPGNTHMKKPANTQCTKHRNMYL